MEKIYSRMLRRWGWAALLLLPLLGRAQSGPFGNEWQVAGQAYYKVQVTQDGVYQLDGAYLQQAGVPAGASPQRVQLWRRGREVALYAAGNQQQLDASTRFEFYGQRNDGALDRGMYQQAGDQPHRLYSLFSDTAAYFLTVGAANGRRVADQPTPAAATPHPNWLQNRLKLFVYEGRDRYYYGQNADQGVFMPWADRNEGFLTNNIDPEATFDLDSLVRRSPAGGQIWVEILLVGSYNRGNHSTTISVLPGGTGTPRVLTTVTYGPYDTRRVRVPLQRSDIGANGRVSIKTAVTNPTNPSTDRFRVGYIRVVNPQTPHWKAGRRSIAFWNDSTQAGAAYYQLDSLPATVVGYDVTDPYNIRRTPGLALAGQQRAYGFAAAVGSTRQLLLADAARALRPAPAKRILFRSINPASHNFLIVSHAALMRPYQGVNQVREYARYRATAGPGHAAYDTLVVTSDQLYDQFHYGERSPLALRQFALYMLTAPRADRYLLLLGKGVLITEDIGGFYRQASAADRARVPDLVPASTRGGSDIFFTADWPNNSYVPRMATGRVPAQTPEHVYNYLNKLKEHEVPTLAPWRKNILHMAGGENPNEHQAFQSFLRGYQADAEKPFFGAHVENIYSNSTTQLVVNITPQVNNGLALITYFGHGSTYTLDLTPLDIRLPASGYNNRGKYPVFYLNGCAVGNNYTGFGSLGEDWVLAANKGAIGFMADSDFGLDGDQNEYCSRMYKLMFNSPTWYGKPMPVIQAEVLRQLNGLSTGAYWISMMMNTTWQGDPAVGIFSPEKPDYQFTPQTTAVSVQPIGSGPVLASSARFNLRLQLSNYGKILPTPLRITVSRTVGTPAVALPTTVATIPYFRRDTTVLVTVNNPAGTSVFGNNTFTVKLDDPNVIDEVDETNNTATLNYNFLNGGVTVLNPTEFAIVGRANVRLVGQSNLPQTQPLDYEFQLDTIPTFRSPLRTGVVRALDVASWTPTLPAPTAGRDSVVYYWRFRFRTAPGSGLDTTWAASSFRYINNSPGGWSQSHYGQMASNEKRNLTQAVPSGRWEFTERTRSLQLSTVGAPDAAATFQLSNGITVDGQPTRVDNCGRYTGVAVAPANMMAAVFEGRNLRQLNSIPGGNYKQCGNVGSTTFFHFATDANHGDSLRLDNLNTPRRQGQLLAFLRNVPQGAYVVLVSMNRLNYSSFRADLKAELTAMGSQLINSAQDGDPLIMVLRKGFPAQAQERTFSPSSPTPRDEQAISLSTLLRTRQGTGTVVSTRIGPAQQWQTLYHKVKLPEATDSYTLRLIGYDAAGTRTVLQSNVTTNGTGYSLSAIDARQYPYLQLEAELRDTTNLTAPQLKQWLVTYRGVPEGVVRRDHPAIAANAYAPATLSAAAASSGVLTIPVYFENVSDTDFAGLTRAKAFITETRAGGRVDTVSVRATRAAGFSRYPRADSTARYDFSLNVASLRGDLTVRIVANSQNLPELITFNNELNLTLTAPNITVPPVLDVAFDGNHILNGDIVSARPEIVVDVKYEDKRRPLTDPNKIELYLTRPGSTTAQQISMSGNSQVSFENLPDAGRSRVTFTPGDLADGVYKLEVQAKDMNDNQAGAQRYAVTFEVVRAAGITNVLPYPNPVTRAARFVFTVTGAAPPRNLKIQILTVSGKLVREITQAELGPLRVGPNISDYAWDGTDQYGGRLANGTYLYRVVLDDAQGEFEHRQSAADKAFRKGWGKIVLLR
jgi:hypothetical protein